MVGIDDGYLKLWQDDGAEMMRYDYEIIPGELCLDLGSYRREWADEMIKRYGCQVECFDALDNRAAWIKEGELEMGGMYYYTSLYNGGLKMKYRCVDISRFMGQEIAVMKINIEGMEYELLEWILKGNLIRNVRNLQVQFHILPGYEEKYKSVSDKLKLTHQLTWRYPFVWENWKRNA